MHCLIWKKQCEAFSLCFLLKYNHGQITLAWTSSLLQGLEFGLWKTKIKVNENMWVTLYANMFLWGTDGPDQSGFQLGLSAFILTFQPKLQINKRGIQIMCFLFLHENICCGYSLEVPKYPPNEYTPYVFKEKYQYFWFDFLRLFYPFFSLLLTINPEWPKRTALNYISL